MKSLQRSLIVLLLLMPLLVMAQVENVLPSRPNPPKIVNDPDKTGFLSSSEMANLEAKLVSYDDTTSNQIAVVMVKSLQGYNEMDYAIALGRKWEVGNKNFNNGIVLLVAVEDRAVAIATGYGLEGALTDLTTQSIIDNSIIPNFKAGRNYEALDAATDDIIKALAGKYKAPKGYGSKKGNDLGKFKTWMILGVIAFIVLSAMFGKGGGGGTYVSSGGFGGWGGFSGGGGSSSGGGGFGGFGGGSFGGGGASGRW